MAACVGGMAGLGVHVVGFAVGWDDGCGECSAVGECEFDGAVGESLGVPLAFVEAVVVVGADQEQVVDVVGAAVAAVVQVVEVAAGSVVAAWYATGAVA